MDCRDNAAFSYSVNTIACSFSCCINSRSFKPLDIYFENNTRHSWFASSTRECYSSATLTHTKPHVSSKIDRERLALPVRLGGMGINNPTKESTYAFEVSERIMAPLVALILAQEINQAQRNDHQKVKHLVKRRKQELQKECTDKIKAQLN